MNGPRKCKAIKKITNSIYPMSSQGFTLIEMLVSVVLMTLMISLSTIALRNMLMSWKRLSVPYPMEAVAYYRLQSAIHSYFPYVVTQSGGYNIGTEKFGYFFEGKETEFRFISLSPLTGAQPVLIRVFLNDQQLLLSETILYAKESDFLKPTENNTTTTTELFTGIRGIHCRYISNGVAVRNIFHRYPRKIEISLVKNSGKMYKFTFLIRSTSMETLKMTKRLGQNV